MRPRFAAFLVGTCVTALGCGLFTVDPDALQGSSGGVAGVAGGADGGDGAGLDLDGAPGADGSDPLSDGGGTPDAPVSDGGCDQPTADTGWLDGDTASGQWIDLSNALLADGNNATIDLSSASGKVLAVRGFGAAVPAGSTVRGVSVEILRSADGAVRDFSLQVSNPLGGVSDGRGRLDPWPGVAAAATYGGPTDAWGLPLTPELANAATISVLLNVTSVSDGGVGVAKVDAVRIKFHYCP